MIVLSAASNDSSPTKFNETEPPLVRRCMVRCLGAGAGAGAGFGAAFLGAAFLGAAFFAAAFLGAAFALVGFFAVGMVSPCVGDDSITGCSVLVFDTIVGGPIEFGSLVFILPRNGPALGCIV